MSTELTPVPKVLVVEDEMILRMRAVDIVEDAGFCPVEAINADEAISILESQSDISLLFTDIQMPGSMDGLKLAHAVHDRWPSIKIILVSGHVQPSDAERPANSRFFVKPLGVEQMTTELQAMVGAGALTIVPNVTAWPADKVLHTIDPSPRSAQEVALAAENDSLRLLLEQAGIDAKTLLVQAGIDARERETADKLQKLILGELHHRIKNTLATVSAIASQSFRAAPSTEHGQKAMEGRLIALGRAHDLLMQVSWANASLNHTLSVPNGRVEIAWTIDEVKQRLHLVWTERLGPVVETPKRRSFGTRMMESLGQQLNGQVQLTYEPDGFVYSLDVPLVSVSAT
jgi:two-component sensor histidine kinase/CheY-like chemotaxis protein